MPSYSSPEATAFSDWTGITSLSQGLTDDQFAALFASILPHAEADVAKQVGVTEFANSDLDAYEVLKLQAAVMDRVAVRFQRRVLNQRLDGTGEPLLIAQAADLLAAIRAFSDLGSPLNTGTDAAATVGDAAAGGMPLVQTAELEFPEQ